MESRPRVVGAVVVAGDVGCERERNEDEGSVRAIDQCRWGRKCSLSRNSEGTRPRTQASNTENYTRLVTCRHHWLVGPGTTIRETRLAGVCVLCTQKLILELGLDIYSHFFQSLKTILRNSKKSRNNRRCSEWYILPSWNISNLNALYSGMCKNDKSDKISGTLNRPFKFWNKKLAPRRSNV